MTSATADWATAGALIGPLESSSEGEISITWARLLPGTWLSGTVSS
ncbi:MAG: hypothetical protein ACRDS1_04920 [Pseudonocardiaceae bacterium]